jgi:hypothetical protein
VHGAAGPCTPMHAMWDKESDVGAHARFRKATVVPSSSSGCSTSSDRSTLPDAAASPRRVQPASRLFGSFNGSLLGGRPSATHADGSDAYDEPRPKGHLIVPGHRTVLPRWIINPTSRRKTAWDVWMAAMIIYSVLVVPMRVGFSWTACIFQADWWWDFFVDFCFAADIALTFRTAVIVDGQQRNQQMLISDVRTIAIKCALPRATLVAPTTPSTPATPARARAGPPLAPSPLPRARPPLMRLTLVPALPLANLLEQVHTLVVLTGPGLDGAGQQHH